MKTKNILFLIFCSSLNYLAAQKQFALEMPEYNTFYEVYQNKVFVASKNGKVVNPKCQSADIKEDKYNGRSCLTINPKVQGDILVYFDVVNVKGKKIGSDSVSFFVRPFPNPVVLTSTISKSTGSKITIGLSKIKCGKQKKLILGNIYAKRDWGHAKDYVNAIWKMLQLKKPGDYVISTGKHYSVKQFVNVAAKELEMKIKWKGKGINTKGFDEKNRLIIECSKKYFRPLEVDTLLGNSQKAKKYLKWKSSFSFTDLVKDMIASDLKKTKNDK